MIYVERPVASEFFGRTEDVAIHDQRLSGLIDASLPEDEAVPLMKRALRRMADA